MIRVTHFGLFLFLGCWVASCIVATWGFAASGAVAEDVAASEEPTTLDIGSFESGVTDSTSIRA